MSVLVKKSPNDAVNTFKAQLVNTTLGKCNKFFGDAYRPFDEFEAFNLDELPTNSDMTFIISQYIECAEKFRADNIKFAYDDGWLWRIDDRGEQISTAPPKKLNSK
jgi:hypothetical protein